VNKTTDAIAIYDCTENKDHCDIRRPSLDEIANFGGVLRTGGTLQIFHVKKGASPIPMEEAESWTGTAYDGIFYKWTGTGLTAIGSMKEWADAVRTSPAKRRLLNKH
jgi:hypothetical protein